MIQINNILKSRFSDKLNIKFLEIKTDYLVFEYTNYNIFFNSKTRYNRFFIRKLNINNRLTILNNKFNKYFLDKISYSIITSPNYIINYDEFGNPIKLFDLPISYMYYSPKQFSFIIFKNDKYNLKLISIYKNDPYIFNKNVIN
jgi:hypothetical protein